MPQDHPIPKTEQTAETPFQRFQRLAKKIVSAPKKKTDVPNQPSES